MEQENTPSDPVTPPADKPEFIGDTNVTDRSNMANVYPQVSTSSQPQPASTSDTTAQSPESSYRQASSALNNAVVLVCGLGSSTGFFLTVFFIRNNWVAIFVAALLAIAAVVFALKEYESEGRMKPLQVLGLSGAAFTIVIVLNYLLLRLLIHSALSGLGD